MNASHPSWQALTKVPKITAYFWVIKILTTGMGESTSDYLVQKLNPYFAVALGFAFFAVALWLQFCAKRYTAWVYWLGVTMVAIFGTMAADVMHVAFGIPYIISAILFAITLAIVFVAWGKTEHTLSVHSITTTRREVFYWLAVLSTFAMGTALGDLAAYTYGLGFLSAGILFGALFLVPAIGWWRFNLNPIFAFWFAYIMTRPLGASFADWMGKPISGGGLGWGNLPVIAVSSALIVGLVGYMSYSRIDAEKK